jgi:hypothetical protein
MKKLPHKRPFWRRYRADAIAATPQMSPPILLAQLFISLQNADG